MRVVGEEDGVEADEERTPAEMLINFHDFSSLTKLRSSPIVLHFLSRSRRFPSQSIYRLKLILSTYCPLLSIHFV